MKGFFTAFKVLILFFLSFAVQASDNTIKIGAIFAKTGEAAEENMVLFQAVRFAVDEVNQLGGIHGRAIELLEYDNHSNAIQSLQAAQRAVADGVLAVIGASWSTHSLAIAPYLQKMQTPMISPDSTNPRLTAIGDYIFRACVSDTWQGKLLSKFAWSQLQGQTAIILQNTNSDYSIGLSEQFALDFASMGGEIKAIINYKSDLNNLDDILSKVSASSPDILFIPGYGESGKIVKSAQNAGIKSKVLGGDTWSYKEFFVHGGQDLHEGYYSSHWNKSLTDTKSVDFVERYGKFYQITDYVAGGYDAAWILFEAMKRAKKIERQVIRDELANTRDFDGVTGRISFDSQGDAIKGMLIIKITDGKTQVLSKIDPSY
ncbi:MULTISPECIES: ABC transporter substrate-binding protein [unclassified Vibrio]|uniref:ABC transporter substrate-binding protein n=1 Tax=Vibrio sp. HB236076 TaxID=3232307 RepID=A0AB39HD63_9VIBR|nr:ABC transporter substrate-binding protein [Vibrio sp. HB161653]MDP5254987.1 ABC transporter substrate-binding protein [Vibrio sp. HB161653]